MLKVRGRVRLLSEPLKGLASRGAEYSFLLDLESTAIRRLAYYSLHNDAELDLKAVGGITMSRDVFLDQKFEDTALITRYCFGDRRNESTMLYWNNMGA